MKCIFYFKKLNDIGGVESFIYYLSKKFDFEFYYKEGNPGFEEQIKRLSYNVPVKKYKGEKLVCDKFFVNYNPDIINNVETKEKIFLIHCDYGQVKFAPPNPKLFDRIIGVSQLVCDSYEKITGVKPELCYNPVYIDKPKVKKKPGLHIIYRKELFENCWTAIVKSWNILESVLLWEKMESILFLLLLS